MECRLRDYRFDNLKGILIFLVVFAHAFSSFKDDSMVMANTVFSIIYSFHMPALIFISGYFSKGSVKNQEYFYKLVKSLLIPFVLMQFLMHLLTHRSVVSLFEPCWTLWFLLSLFFWRILIVPFVMIRFSLAVAILLSILIGFSPATQLISISRTVSFFPIFLLGYKISATQIREIVKVNKVISVIIFSLIICCVGILQNHKIPMSTIFLMDRRYANIECITEEQGALLRFAALLIGVVSTFCLLNIVKDNRTIITDIGKNSITVYLGHSLFLLLFRKVIRIVSPDILTNETILLLYMLILSLLICLAFGNKWVSVLYKKVIDSVSLIVLEQAD